MVRGDVDACRWCESGVWETRILERVVLSGMLLRCLCIEKGAGFLGRVGVGGMGLKWEYRMRRRVLTKVGRMRKKKRPVRQAVSDRMASLKSSEGKDGLFIWVGFEGAVAHGSCRNVL